MKDFKKFLKASLICVIITIIGVFFMDYTANSDYGDIKETTGIIRDIEIVTHRNSHHSYHREQKAMIEYVNPNNGETFTKPFLFDLNKNIYVGQEITMYYDTKFVDVRKDTVRMKSHPTDGLSFIFSFIPMIGIPMAFINTSFEKHSALLKTIGIIFFYNLMLCFIALAL